MKKKPEQEQLVSPDKLNYGAVDGAVYWTVNVAVYRAVYGAVYGEVSIK